MAYPSDPFKPYDANHQTLKGPGDARPTTLQVLKDNNAFGKLKGKTILITGCSAGLGVETARGLYETGATLFLTARDMKKLDGVIDDIVQNAQHNKDGPRPQAVEMHLDSLESVRKGVEAFKQQSGNKLNILIENAGVMACPFTPTKDGYEQQLGVNHFAHFLLFQLLRPTLITSAKESGSASRVIVLSSAAHRRGGLLFSDEEGLNAWNKGDNYDKWKAYAQAKTANVYMANELDRRYGSQNVVGVSVHPGGILTDLPRHLSQEDLAALGVGDSMAHIFKNPSQGAATTVWAAVSPHFEGKNGGRYLEDVGESSPAQEGTVMGDPGYEPHAYDKKSEEMLWKISCKVVGVQDD
ncbi:hypothetical protein BDY17DRAFT_339316 [Neohortaea acidophila]|uniref:Short-chain dehydrogenase n=1 Tax=Neohortaea acidophila TaxID=245834 RepID=A0A6A6PUL9_9PEZI|nr:uncharacterized protein BDY17DRAFT_339316 [Neohortaea acidophila]KAF2483394.1 hypothetical protein BDY17DRAFT_339316 [Neohortaea acidophila]